MLICPVLVHMHAFMVCHTVFMAMAITGFTCQLCHQPLQLGTLQVVCNHRFYLSIVLPTLAPGHLVGRCYNMSTRHVMACLMCYSNEILDATCTSMSAPR